MRKLILFAVTLCCAALDAGAYELTLDASGSPQRFEGTVQWAVNQDASRDVGYAAVLPAIQRAFDGWQNAAPGRLAFQNVGPTSLGPPAPGEARLGAPVTLSWEEKAWNYVGDDQAVTILVEDPETHVILRADIVFNGVTHHWADLSDGMPHPGCDDVQNTLTHEIGHLLGFGHVTDEQSTMYPSTYPGDLARRLLDAQDVAGIDALYAANPSTAEQNAGCSTAPGRSSGAVGLLLALAALLGRRPRRGY